MTAAAPPPATRVPAALFALGVVVHAVAARTMPVPVDVDAQYYLAVARNLAAGEGAVTRSLWNLSVLPDALPAPADLYWMPLPSRVLVPGLLLWPAAGERLVTVLLAACLAPLAWALARRGGAEPRLAVVAGVLAAFGGIYLRLLSAPDVYALVGVLGAVGCLAAADRRPGLAFLVGLLAGFARTDGFLLAPCLALAFRGRAALAVAASGPAAAAAWMLRNHLVAGDAYWEARAIALSASDYLSIFDGVVHAPLTLGGRLRAVVDAVPGVLELWVTPGLLVLTPVTLWGAWTLRDRGWVRAFAAYTLLTPWITVVLAPAVADHGTFYRAAAAMLPAHLALAAVGLGHAADWGVRVRGYPRAFLPVLLAGTWLVISVGHAVLDAFERRRGDECPLVADLPLDEPVFSTQPLALEVRCGRPGVMITRSTPPERVAEVAERYGVRVLVLPPGGWRDEATPDEADLRRLLPGWECRGDRWEAPSR